MMGEPIPAKMRAEMDADPYYHKCVRRHEGGCEGRITWEHAWIYAGRKINEKWAIIPLCEYHHLRAGLYKALNQLIALRRATPEDLAKYPRKNWAQELRSLEIKVK